MDFVLSVHIGLLQIVIFNMPYNKMLGFRRILTVCVVLVGCLLLLPFFFLIFSMGLVVFSF